MSIEITLFNPSDAGPDDFAELHAVTAAAHVADRPDMPVPTLEATTARLMEPMTAPGPSVFWTARKDGAVAGTASVHFPEAENDHTAVVTVTVHPASRRAGIGTDILRTILPELAARNRRLLIGRSLTALGAGERWAATAGFHVVDRVVLQSLEIAEADPARWEARPLEGYRLERWTDAAPDHLVASYARARCAIHDAPTGDSSTVIPEWTVKQIREEEADWRARDFDFTVVAVCDDHGEVVGVTEMALHPSQPKRAMQQYTAIVPEHRGHGLGHMAKAAMMRWLVAERPHVERVSTSTGAQNVHMIRVNEQLGYSTLLTVVDVEAELDTVVSEVGVAAADG